MLLLVTMTVIRSLSCIMETTHSWVSVHPPARLRLCHRMTLALMLCVYACADREGRRRLGESGRQGRLQRRTQRSARATPHLVSPTTPLQCT